MPSLKNLSGTLPKTTFHHELLPQEDEERLEKLFKKLDKDGNGKIDIHDLSDALKKYGVHQHYAEVSVKVVLVCSILFLMQLACKAFTELGSIRCQGFCLNACGTLIISC